MYLIVFLVYLINVPVLTCTVLYSTPDMYRYGTNYRYKSITHPMTHVQGGLLLGVGDGGGEVRYRTSFSPKSRSGSGGSGSAGTFTYFGGAAHLGYLLPVTVEAPAADLTFVFFLSVA
jgi:hypothetical protein